MYQENVKVGCFKSPRCNSLDKQKKKHWWSRCVFAGWCVSTWQDTPLCTISLQKSCSFITFALNIGFNYSTSTTFVCELHYVCATDVSWYRDTIQHSQWLLLLSHQAIASMYVFSLDFLLIKLDFLSVLLLSFLHLLQLIEKSNSRSCMTEILSREKAQTDLAFITSV